jgi:hypothetical protein
MPLIEFAANMFRKQFREAADSADRTEISPAGHVLPPQPALTSEKQKNLLIQFILINQFMRREQTSQPSCHDGTSQDVSCPELGVT